MQWNLQDGMQFSLNWLCIPFLFFFFVCDNTAAVLSNWQGEQQKVLPAGLCMCRLHISRTWVTWRRGAGCAWKPVFWWKFHSCHGDYFQFILVSSAEVTSQRRRLVSHWRVRWRWVVQCCCWDGIRSCYEGLPVSTVLFLLWKWRIHYFYSFLVSFWFFPPSVSLAWRDTFWSDSLLWNVWIIVSGVLGIIWKLIFNCNM